MAKKKKTPELTLLEIEELLDEEFSSLAEARRALKEETTPKEPEREPEPPEEPELPEPPDKKGRKQTPTHLDYLFERSIIDENDYRDFWQAYWKRDASGRRALVKEYTQMALEFGGRVVGVVIKNRRDAVSQANAIGGRVVRRNKRGRFSERGHYFQAIKKGGKKK